MKNKAFFLLYIVLLLKDIIKMVPKCFAFPFNSSLFSCSLFHLTTNLTTLKRGTQVIIALRVWDCWNDYLEYPDCNNSLQLLHFKLRTSQKRNICTRHRLKTILRYFNLAWSRYWKCPDFFSMSMLTFSYPRGQKIERRTSEKRWKKKTNWKSI